MRASHGHSSMLVTIVLLVTSQSIVGKSTDPSNLSCTERCDLRGGFCTPQGECKCLPGWEGEGCDQCSVARGCVHGYCDQPWQCNCEKGWGGRHCDLDLKYCQRHQPCKNGATCVGDSRGSYVCVCAPNYGGKNCDVDLRTTVTQPPPTSTTKNLDDFCLNGGTCVFGNQFVGCESCSCLDGYSGDRCEDFVRMCATMPCANGGKCHNIPGDFQCECARGYSGRFCTEDRDECVEMGHRACHNGGTCLNRVGSFSCLCLDGFEGARCDRRVRRLPAPSDPPVVTSTTTDAAQPGTVHKPAGHVITPETRLVAERTQQTTVSSSDPGPNQLPRLAGEKKYVNNVKVTHLVHQVQLGSESDVYVEQVVVSSHKSIGSSSSDQASVSVVQAVTFSFLGVAVVLFVAIAAFVWYHCSRRRSSSTCASATPDLEVSQALPAVCADHACNRSNFVVVPLDDHQKPHTSSGYCDVNAVACSHASRPQLQARPGGPVLASPRGPAVDCLYVALPQDSVSDYPSSLSEERKGWHNSTNHSHYRH